MFKSLDFYVDCVVLNSFEFRIIGLVCNYSLILWILVLDLIFYSWVLQLLLIYC